ncbi:MAG: N-acetylmuramoyl-L-alanine amidase [Miltoncostaeaceae bacterium]
MSPDRTSPRLPSTVLVVLIALVAFLGAAGAAMGQGAPLIAIDPGHGGDDTGAVGILAPGTSAGLPERSDDRGRAVMYEKDVNLDLAYRLEALLRARGLRTVMTRTRDLAGGDRPYTTTRADLAARTNLANEVGADLFISIHNNAIGSPAVGGTETFHYYYSSEAARLLAREIQDEMVSVLGRPDRGVKEAGFYVLRHTAMPAVLLEGAFLTNAEDLALLADPALRQALAEGVSRGVRRFLAGGGLEGEDAAESALAPTLGPWARRPGRAPEGYRLVKTGKSNPVGRGGWLAVREGLTFPAAERARVIGPWKRKPRSAPDGYRLVRSGVNGPYKGAWLAVRV